MAKKKQILVSDILDMMNETDKVCVMLYAYGVYYGDTVRDGMHTVAECKDQMNYDCIHALTTRIRTENDHVVIQGEIVHWGETMLKYFRQDKLDHSRNEITYEEALHIMLGTWKDNDMTRDMLTIPNTIQCRFSIIEVEDHKGDGDIMVLMAGMYNMLPMNIDYDEDGNHLK